MRGFFLYTYLMSEQAPNGWQPPQTISEVYRGLNLQSSASDEEVKKARKTFAIKYHPDQHRGGKEQRANDVLQRVNRAVDILLNPEIRKQFEEGKIDFWGSQVMAPPPRPRASPKPEPSTKADSYQEKSKTQIDKDIEVLAQTYVELENAISRIRTFPSMDSLTTEWEFIAHTYEMCAKFGVVFKHLEQNPSRTAQMFYESYKQRFPYTATQLLREIEKCASSLPPDWVMNAHSYITRNKQTNENVSKVPLLRVDLIFQDAFGTSLKKGKLKRDLHKVDEFLSTALKPALTSFYTPSQLNFYKICKKLLDERKKEMWV
jgi:curved DNA-binding protein CbpA